MAMSGLSASPADGIPAQRPPQTLWDYAKVKFWPHAAVSFVPPSSLSLLSLSLLSLSLSPPSHEYLPPYSLQVFKQDVESARKRARTDADAARQPSTGAAAAGGGGGGGSSRPLSGPFAPIFAKMQTAAPAPAPGSGCPGSEEEDPESLEGLMDFTKGDKCYYFDTNGKWIEGKVIELLHRNLKGQVLAYTVQHTGDDGNVRTENVERVFLVTEAPTKGPPEEQGELGELTKGQECWYYDGGADEGDGTWIKGKVTEVYNSSRSGLGRLYMVQLEDLKGAVVKTVMAGRLFLAAFNPERGIVDDMAGGAEGGGEAPRPQNAFSKMMGAGGSEEVKPGADVPGGELWTPPLPRPGPASDKMLFLMDLFAATRSLTLTLPRSRLLLSWSQDRARRGQGFQEPDV